MTNAKDQLDKVHDILASDGFGAVMQSRVEGSLDVPFTAAIGAIGRGGDEGDRIRVVAILNYVGRTLRDAYGREEYEAGLAQAQADLYEKGVGDAVEQAKGAMADLSGALGGMADTYAEFNRTRLLGELRLMNRGAVAGAVGACVSLAFGLAMAWNLGIVTFH